MSKDESDIVEMDLEALAFASLSRAIADYTTLNGQDEPFVRAFLSWAWQNTDGEAVMERFKSVPDRMRPQ